ncbi:MAG TPA: GMC family oxidoreductase [Acidimicrobiales bacterium]|nr:GMC family oxidoreductase [Acidimicrobiales bacterium]
MTVDAIIVGSGPGGATVADVLTAAGWSVVIFEKGRNHLIDLEDPTKLAHDFSNDEIKFVFRHFLGPDPFLEPRTFRTGIEEGDRSFVGDVNSVPSTVGGGGTHADGKVPRFREVDFEMLSTFGPQDGAAVADWPLSYADLEPFYADVERRIGVSGEAGANPFAAWRSGPYPMPPGPSMYGATLSAAAAEQLGYHPYPAPGATNSLPYDGRPACNNCGFCSFFGCPIHAKGDPVAMLQRALLSGHAEIRPETFVSRIRTEGNRATGVDFIGPDGVERSLDARYVVVAGGAVETPRLLLLSGFDHPLIGRHLMVHVQTIVVGGFADRRFHTERGRAVTHVHDDPMVPDDASRAAAAQAGLPWMRGGMVEHGGPSLPVLEAKLYRWGALHKAHMRESPLRDRLWALTMQGEDLPLATNRVDLDPAVRDVRGFPAARFTYRPHKHELVASAHHGPRLAAILESLGAEWTSIVTSPGTGESPGGRSMPSVPMSRHVMGTVRMGEDPATSVVDGYGRLHDTPNVIVADSSVFVTSSGYGPTLTLAALAARSAAALVG